MPQPQPTACLTKALTRCTVNYGLESRLEKRHHPSCSHQRCHHSRRFRNYFGRSTIRCRSSQSKVQGLENLHQKHGDWQEPCSRLFGAPEQHCFQPTTNIPSRCAHSNQPLGIQSNVFSMHSFIDENHTSLPTYGWLKTAMNRQSGGQGCCVPSLRFRR